MVQVDGGREFSPLPAVSGSALDPDGQILINKECLGPWGYMFPSLLLPHLTPLCENIVPRLVTKHSGVM